MVKEADASNLTAAIGDGGNDVSMIQEAQLGMGIIGVEGDAAAKAADFAFAKVRWYSNFELLFYNSPTEIETEW